PKAQRGVWGLEKSNPPLAKAARFPPYQGGGAMPTSRGKLLLQSLRIVAPSGQPFLRHVARIEILDAFAQGLDDRASERGGGDLRRRQELVPFVVERTGEDIDDAD